MFAIVGQMKNLTKDMEKKQKTKTIFKRITATMAIFLAFFVFSGMNFVYATGINDAINGLNDSGGKMHGVSDPSAVNSGVINNIPEAIGTVVGAILAFVGTLFFILIIYSGFTWMLARGNESEVQKAKDMLEAAVIGLIIVLSAYAITSYVGTQILGS